MTRAALDQGVIDVAVLFSTDPAIDDLVELADDRGLQPAENVTPLVRRSVVERSGAPLVEVVDSVSRRLTTDSLRALNGAARGRRVDGRRRRGALVEVRRDRVTTARCHCAFRRARDRVAGARRARRRRCREASALSGIGWIVATAALLVWSFIALHADWALRITDRVDSAVLRQIARVRSDWLTDVLDRMNRVAMGWTMTIAAIGLIVTLMVFRRWRHLFTFVGSVLATRAPRCVSLPRVRAAASLRRHGHRALARVRVSVGPGRRAHLHCHRDRLHAGRARATARDRDRGGGRDRDSARLRAALSRCGPPVRRARGHRAAGRDPAQRLPLLHAE